MLHDVCIDCFRYQDLPGLVVPVLLVLLILLIMLMELMRAYQTIQNAQQHPEGTICDCVMTNVVTESRWACIATL